MNLTFDAWLEVINGEYLDTFIPQGGSAIKFLVTERTDLELADDLLAHSRTLRFVSAEIDGGVTRVSQIDSVFCAVARDVRWEDLAGDVRSRAITECGLTETIAPVTFDSLAESNGLLPYHVEDRIQRWLATSLFADHQMSTEFRMAMMVLILDPMGSTMGPTPLYATVLDWLKGEPLMLSALRPAQIYQRIGRHNARDLFVSLGRWVHTAGRPGLHVVLDARSIAVSKRAGAAPGSFYGTPQLKDLYELLRQFIDGTDDLQHTFMSIILPPAFLTDDVRGLRAYRALEMRIAQEVRDRKHPNPLAAMVRLGEVSA